MVLKIYGQNGVSLWRNTCNFHPKLFLIIIWELLNRFQKLVDQMGSIFDVIQTLFRSFSS